MSLLTDLYKKFQPAVSFVKNEANALNQKRIDAAKYLSNNVGLNRNFFSPDVTRQTVNKVVTPVKNAVSTAGKSFVNTILQPAVAGTGEEKFNQPPTIPTNVRAYNQGVVNKFNTGGRTDTATNVGNMVGSAAPYFIPGANIPVVSTTLGNQIGNNASNDKLFSTDTAKDVGQAGLNLIPGFNTSKYTAGFRPFIRSGANALIAGGENVIRGQGSSLIETGKPNTNANENALQFAIGAGLHTVLHPKETIAGVNDAGQAVKNEFLNPVRKPGFINIANNDKISNAVQQNIDAGMSVEQAVTEARTKFLGDKGGINVSTGEPVSPGIPVNKERGFVTSGKESTLDPLVKDALKGTYDVKKNPQLMKDVQTAMQKEGTYAMQERLMNAPINKMTDTDVASVIALAHLHNSEGNYAASADLINKLAPELTAAGRKVQAASLIDKMTPEGVQYIASKELQKIGKNLDPAVAAKLAEQAKVIRGMGQGRDRNIAVNQMMTDIQNLIPSSNWDKFITTWKAGLLTSPKTTIRNLAGNTLNAGAEMAKDPFATLADGVMAAFTGERTQTSTLKGTLSGAREGLSTAKDILKYGFDPSAESSKFDLNHITWGNNKIEQGLKKYTETVFGLLESQDKPFYESAFKRSLYDQAGAEAINQRKRGDTTLVESLVKNPTPEMVTTAHNDASVATFKNKTVATSIINSAKQKAKAAHPAVGAALDFVVPFTGVPTSVAGQMISYSPFGLAKGLVNASKVIVNPSNFSHLQRQAAQDIGRGVIGTGVMALGAELMRRGLMTGDYPQDNKTQEQWKLDGRQANSILINGKWRAVNSIGPQASMLLVGGKMGEKDKMDSSGNPINKTAQTVAAMGKTVSDASFLQGIQGVLDAVNDPTQNASKWVNSSVSGTVPNIVRDVAKGADVNDKGMMIQREINSTLDAVKNSIPGLRSDQLPQRDVFGNQVTGGMGYGVNAFDIFNSRPAVTADPVTNELQRLNNSDNSATPSKMANKQTAFGTKMVLTPEQLDQLEQATGGQIKQKFSELMNSPLYQQVSDEQKAKSLNDLVSQVRTSNKNQLFVDQGNTGNVKTIPNIKNGTTPTIPTGTLASTSVAAKTKAPTKEEVDLAKYLVETGQKESMTVGNIYVGIDPATGNVVAKTMDRLKSDAVAQKLKNDIELAKTSGDFANWQNLQKQLFISLQNKISSSDPTLNQADILRWQNQQSDIVRNVSKYNSYGGFKKPKKAKAIKIGSTKIKSIKSPKAKTPKITQPKIKSMKIKLPKV